MSPRRCGDPELRTWTSFDHSVDRDQFSPELVEALSKLAAATVENWPGRDWAPDDEEFEASPEYWAGDHLLFRVHDLLAARPRVAPERQGDLPGFCEPKDSVLARVARIEKAVRDIEYLNETRVWSAIRSLSDSRLPTWKPITLRIEMGGLDTGLRDEMEVISDPRILEHLPRLLREYRVLVEKEVEAAPFDRFGNRERSRQQHRLLKLVKGTSNRRCLALVSEFIEAFARHKGIDLSPDGPESFHPHALRKFARRHAL